MNSVGYEFVTNSAPEPLGSGTLGCDTSVAAGPWCRLAGSDGPVVRTPLRSVRSKERAGRAGPVRRFRPTAKLKLEIPFLFQNLFIICKLI
jgi:hypothetical protein